jgi:hypothetical protein
MKAQTAPVTASLEEMESQLQTLQRERVNIEDRLDTLRRRKTEKEQEARPLKKQLVDGDKSASAKLDRIDAEIRDIVRSEDTLREAEAFFAPKIIALQKQVNETKRIRQDEEKSQRFDADCDALAKATEEFLAAHAVATEKLAEMFLAAGRLLAEWGTRRGFGLRASHAEADFEPSPRAANGRMEKTANGLACDARFYRSRNAPAGSSSFGQWSQQVTTPKITRRKTKMLRVSEYDTDARRFDDRPSLDPRLPAAKAALGAAREKLRRCELELAAIEPLKRNRARPLSMMR